jgi:hypothetical protein
MAVRPQVSAELRCVGALRHARSSFFSDILSHARTHLSQTKSVETLTDEDIDELRSDATYQVAEFFYVARARKLADRETIRLFLRGHNEAMRGYIGDKTKRELTGVTVASAKKGLFSDIQINKVVENIVEGKLRLDQSDLGRILASVFAAETTRNAVISIAKGGLINRVRVGQVTLVVSNGVLEDYFHKHLSLIIKSIQ